MADNDISSSRTTPGNRATKLLDPRATMTSSAEPVLRLRDLQKGNGLGQTIECPKSSVTVIVEDEKNGVDYYRKALFGLPEKNLVDIRYGAREVHLSEIFRADVSNYRWQEDTVRQSLIASGCPEERAEDLLREIGLWGREGDLLETLSKQELHRLLICSSFFSKSAFVHFDEPFLAQHGKWLERMGDLMLDAVQLTQKVFLVTGVKRIPQAWVRSKTVQTVVCSLDGIERLTAAIEKQTHEISKALEGAFASRRDDAAPDIIVTRPQVIPTLPVRKSQQERVQHEAIQNPTVLNGSTSNREVQQGVPVRSPLTRLPTLYRWKQQLLAKFRQRKSKA